MEPTISAGDVIFVSTVPPDRIGVGDVVTFRRESGERRPTTHRVVEVVTRDGDRYFRTKGDANEEPDPRLVSGHELQGRVMFGFPYFGYFLQIARSKGGILLFVIVPAILLVVTESYDLIQAYRADRDQETPAATDSSSKEP